MRNLELNILPGLIAACICLQSSCSPFNNAENHQPVRAYLLEGTCSRDSTHPEGARDRVLAIAPTRSAPGYDTNRMAYMVKPYRLDHFAFHRWMAPPASMFHRNLLNAIGERGTFRAVVDGTSPARTDLRLETEGFFIRQVFENGESRAETGLRARLLELETRRVLAERSFNLSEPSGKPHPEEGIHAANHAACRLMDEIMSWMESALSSVPESGAP